MEIMKTGSTLIAEERERQLADEAWTPEHDDTHTNGELALAAVCYAAPEAIRDNFPPRMWPYEGRWWKPCPDNRVRELVKAGALIAAEIDRLQRIK
jgi:hypothetical protein